MRLAWRVGRGMSRERRKASILMAIALAILGVWSFYKIVINPCSGEHVGRVVGVFHTLGDWLNGKAVPMVCTRAGPVTMG